MNGKISIRTLLYIFSFIFVSNTCFSQDTIVKITKDTLQAKILEVGLSEIRYKRFDNPEGPVFVISKSEIVLIRYENGSTDSFPSTQTTPPTATGIAASNNVSPKNEINQAPILSPEQLKMKGQKDATRHYDGYKGAGTGTLVTSLVSPVLGLIPAISCASTKPQSQNLNYPDPDLMTNYSYRSGYVARAKQIKQGRVWTNWGIGLGVNFILALALID